MPGIGLCAVDCTNLALLLRCYCVIERRIIPFIFVLEPHFPDMRKILAILLFQSMFIKPNASFENHRIHHLWQISWLKFLLSTPTKLVVYPKNQINLSVFSWCFSHICFSPDSLSPPIHRGFGVHRLIKCGGREWHCTMHTEQCTLNYAQ